MHTRRFEDAVREQLYNLVRAYIEKCNRCGDCRSVCPVFAEDPEESAVARGKILLAGRVLSGQLPPSPVVLERLDRCLLCESCTFGCAFHLRVDRVVMAARAFVAEAIGLPGAKRLVFDALAEHRGVLGLACAAGALTAPLWSSRVAPESGLRLRFPLVPGIPADRVLPRPAARPFLSQVPRMRHVSGSTRTVAFFVGCYVNYILPPVGRDVLSLLGRAGVSVNLVKEQRCCGTPMAASGDLPRALRLMEANVRALLAAKPDAVVVACATCGTALRDLYPNTLAKLEPGLAEMAQELAARTYDITEFLASVAPIPDKPALRRKLSVTYHDSCHLARGLGIRGQPRELLEGIGNLELVEMDRADVCCGGAGAFSFTQQRLSRRILGHKVDTVLATGAEVVVSGCHGCNLQLADGLVRASAPVRPLHTVQVLERAYREARSR